MPTYRRLTSILAAALLTTAVAACGSSEEEGGDASGPLKVGASPVPHAEILTFVKDNLAADAELELEIIEFTDYIQPNVALAENQIDANYFQTVPYLEEQSLAAGYDFISVGGVHLEPLGLYSEKVDTVADLPQGGQIAIPNDPSNGGRALRLLADNDLITLADTGDVSPSVRDITENPKELKFTEVEAAQLARSLQDVDGAVINGNYAIQADLNPAQDALVLESTEGNPNINVLVVRNGDQDDPRVQTLIGLLQGPEVAQFINDKYSGAVIPAQ